MFFDLNCANDRAISLGPKRSTERMFSKKSCFHGYKSFWPTFSRLMECNKPQRTIYKDEQVFLTFTLEFIGALFRN